MDPVTLIAGPEIEPAWYRCPSCGTRQRAATAPTVGGIACTSCGAMLHAREQIGYAPLNARLLSLLVDAGILFVMYIFLSLFVWLFTPIKIDAAGQPDFHKFREGQAVVAAVLICYCVVSEIVGQSAGKRAVGIRVVVSHNWGRPGILRGIARSILGVASILPLGLGYWILLADPEHRAFHDRVTGTRVIER